MIELWRNAEFDANAHVPTPPFVCCSHAGGLDVTVAHNKSGDILLDNCSAYIVQTNFQQHGYRVSLTSLQFARVTESCCDVSWRCACVYIFLHNGCVSSLLQGGEVDTQDLVLNGTLASAGCGVSVRVDLATTRIEQYYSKAVHYSLMVAFVTFIQVPSCCGTGQEWAICRPGIKRMCSMYTLKHT